MPKCDFCGKTLKTEKGKKIHEATCGGKVENTPEPVKPSEPEKATSSVIEASMERNMKSMKEHLDSQPKVSFYVPLGDNEREGDYETVQLNGYTVQVKKGVQVQLPQQIAEVLMNKYKVNTEAGRDMRLDRDSDVTNSLS